MPIPTPESGQDATAERRQTFDTTDFTVDGAVYANALSKARRLAGAGSPESQNAWDTTPRFGFLRVAPLGRPG